MKPTAVEDRIMERIKGSKSAMEAAAYRLGAALFRLSFLAERSWGARKPTHQLR
jgi:hypothetical protein